VVAKSLAREEPRHCRARETKRIVDDLSAMFGDIDVNMPCVRNRNRGVPDLKYMQAIF